jgi:hypothetical protein
VRDHTSPRFSASAAVQNSRFASPAALAAVAGDALRSPGFPALRSGMQSGIERSDLKNWVKDSIRPLLCASVRADTQRRRKSLELA